MKKTEVIRQMTEEKKQKRVLFLISVGLVLATIASYEPVRNNDFVSYDDNLYITKNAMVQSGLNANTVKWAFTKPHSSMWHPLTTLSHIVDCQLFGLKPAGHHLVSVGIHIINSLLLFWILTNLTGSVWASAFVAGVFALHPLQVEAVAWASERKSVLSGLFWFLTIAVYIWYTKRASIRRYIAVFVIYGLCIMTKPVVVTLPLVLLLLDYWPLRRFDNLRTRPGAKYNLIIEKLPLLGLAGMLAVITARMQSGGGVIISMEQLSLGRRIANAFISFISYIGKFIWPERLGVPYPITINDLKSDVAIGCMALFALLLVLSVVFGKKKRYLATGWLWFAGTLVPMIGLVQSGGQAMADRYMYLSIIGLLFIITWGAKDIIDKHLWLRNAAFASAGVILLILGVLTHTQAGYWKNSLTLFGHTLKVTQSNPIAENAYGCALMREGRLKEAEQHLRTAIYIAPSFREPRNNLCIVLVMQNKFDDAIISYKELVNNGARTPEIYYDLATLLKTQNRSDEATSYYKSALAIDPGFTNARKKLVGIFLETGRLNEAIEQLNQVPPNDPNYADARKRTGILLTSKGRIDEAIPYFNEALRTESKSGKVQIYENIALAYKQNGKYKEAIRFWNMALKLEPNNIPILNSAAWLLATTDDTSIEDANKAIEFSKRACELTGYKGPSILDTLATAYAASGKFDDAISTANKAFEAAKAAGYNNFADEIQERIKLYKTHQRYHQTQKTNE
jgi:tetratricopeptide (TPR) repeat protein